MKFRTTIKIQIIFFKISLQMYTLFRFSLHLLPITMLVVKFHSSRSKGNALWVLIPSEGSTYAFFAEYRPYFFSRGLNFFTTSETVDLSMRFIFELDTFTLSRNKKYWQTDKRTAEWYYKGSVFFLLVRNPKNHSAEFLFNMKPLTIFMN